MTCKYLKVISNILLMLIISASNLFAQHEFFIKKDHRNPHLKLYNSDYNYSSGYFAGFKDSLVVIRLDENNQLFSYPLNILQQVDFRKGAGFWPVAGTTYSILLAASLTTLAVDDDFFPPLARYGILAGLSVPVAVAAGSISELSTERFVWEKEEESLDVLINKLSTYDADTIHAAFTFPEGAFLNIGHKTLSPKMENSQHHLDIFIGYNSGGSTFGAQASDFLTDLSLKAPEISSNFNSNTSIGALYQHNDKLAIGAERYRETFTRAKATVYDTNHDKLFSYSITAYYHQTVFKLQYAIWQQPVKPELGVLWLGVGLRRTEFGYFQYFNVNHDDVTTISRPTDSQYDILNNALDAELVYKIPWTRNFSFSVKAFGSFYQQFSTNPVYFNMVDGNTDLRAEIGGNTYKINQWGLRAALHWRLW